MGRLRKRYIIEDMKKIAKERYGKCLSEEYIDMHTKLEWQCDICGNIWQATPSNIIYNNAWCPQCARERTIKSNKYTIKYAQTIAKERGGKCLSEEYVGIDINLEWECGICYYQWDATLGNVINHDSWCPKCAGNIKNTIEDARELAKKFNGKCLSEEYVNCISKLMWECQQGHVFLSSYNHVFRGSWCPYCKNKSEQKFREAMEDVFNIEFPKKRPKWLINKEGNRLELDGYNKKLGIAFEYQGKQHFKVLRNNYFGGKEEFKKRQEHDLIKKKICEQKDIILLCPTHNLKEEDFIDFIKNNIDTNRYK